MRRSVAALYAAAAACAGLGCAVVALELRWRYVLIILAGVWAVGLIGGYIYIQRQPKLEESPVDPLAHRQPAKGPGWRV